MKSQEFRFALVQTIPVMMGYIFLGVAFGLLLQRAGFNFIWAFCISTFVFAGSMQFVLVSLLSGGAGLLSAALMTLSINSRHLFYGLSFIEKFRAMGRARWYMIFSLTDETYSLLCSVKVPEGMSEKRVLLWIAALDQCWWVLGSVLGSLVGELLRFDLTGIDFAMTALFVVIFIEQCLAADNHLPALIGAFCGLLSLIVFGADSFILPALVAAVFFLLVFRRQSWPRRRPAATEEVSEP